MLKALMDKAENMKEQMGNINRDGNSKKPIRKARDQKHCNRNKECI